MYIIVLSAQWLSTGLFHRGREVAASLLFTGGLTWVLKATRSINVPNAIKKWEPLKSLLVMDVRKPYFTSGRNYDL
jgi:hypothetical protein